MRNYAPRWLGQRSWSALAPRTSSVSGGRGRITLKAWGIALAMGGIALAGSAARTSAVPSHRPRTPTVAAAGGLDLRQWETRWWRWRLGLSGKHASSEADRCISRDQRPPVWLLGTDSIIAHRRVVACRIPRHAYLLLAVPAIDCSTAERQPFTAPLAGLRRCAEHDWAAGRPLLVITLDGHYLPQAQASVLTEPFRFRMPVHDNFLEVPGQNSGTMAVKGRATLLRPLPPGRHDLSVEWHYEGVPRFVTHYMLVVA
jgi:hypothetical protein